MSISESNVGVQISAASGSMTGSGPSPPGRRSTFNPPKTRATFNYKNNPAMSEELKEMMAMFDQDGSGQVTTAELVAAAKAHQETQAQSKLMATIVKVLLVTLLVMLGCMFGLTIVAVEMSKETKVSDQVMVTTAGAPVQVESAQMVVAPTGELLMRPEPGADGDARLLGTKSRSLKTGGITRTLRVQPVQVGSHSRRLQEDEPGAQEDDCWEADVSTEDAEGLLEQLEAAPDTEVFFDFGDSQVRAVLKEFSHSGGSRRLHGKVGAACLASGCDAAHWYFEHDNDKKRRLESDHESGVDLGRRLSGGIKRRRAQARLHARLAYSHSRRLDADEEVGETESRELGEGQYSLIFCSEPEFATTGALTQGDVMVTTEGKPVQVESSQMVVAPNGELLMRPELHGDARLLLGVQTAVKTAGMSFTVRVGGKSERRLQEDEPGEEEDDSEVFEVSAEDAEGLLAQLEADRTSQVFLDFEDSEVEDSEDEDPEGEDPEGEDRRLQRRNHCWCQGFRRLSDPEDEGRRLGGCKGVDRGRGCAAKRRLSDPEDEARQLMDNTDCCCCGYHGSYGTTVTWCMSPRSFRRLSAAGPSTSARRLDFDEGCVEVVQGNMESYGGRKRWTLLHCHSRQLNGDGVFSDREDRQLHGAKRAHQFIMVLA